MKLVMAGGGTGGHLFPALALAEEIKGKDSDTQIIFIGGRGGIEERIVPRYGYPLILLSVEGIKRRTGMRRAAALLKAANSTIRAVGILREIRPDGVIGSGSYSSAPVVLAAKLLGIRTAIMEQNALPGLTNKVLGKFVDRVYVAFDEARGYFPASRTVLSGNPVRKEILERAAEKTGRTSDKFTILVFGGSQGATAINAAFIDAAEYLTDIWGGLRVMHQTGSDGFEHALAAYRRKKLKVDVHKFIDDMADAYYGADLVVCRAGATSIAEFTVFGLPSILVPYPFASDDHQSINAASLAEKGAALVIRQDKLTGRVLADAIRRLYENPQEFKAMREKAKLVGRPKAAEIIAADFSKAIKSRKNGRA